MIPLAVGGLSGFLTRNAFEDYAAINQPDFAPPGWLFPIVWTMLYILMGISCYLVWESGSPLKSDALRIYIAQLAVNFVWPLVFFGLNWYLAAFAVLIALWTLILLTMRAFSKIDERAGDLLLPYILWVTFAAYLNLGVFLLN